MYTVGLYTLGCKVSQYETEAIAEEFARQGFEIGSFSDKNDVYVINTCTVTAESDRKSRQIIRRAVKQNGEAVVAVVGCYSQRSAKEVAAIDGVDIVIGTDGKLGVVGASLDLLAKKTLGEEYEQIISVSDVEKCDFESMTVTRAPRTRAYVKIEDGCECKCTYCAISDARGRVRSKPRLEVLSEVKGLFDSGIGEVVLTGIETGSYGRDFDTEYGLADLICELDTLCPGGRIRLGSLSPELIDKKFIDKVRGVNNLLPHFHLSMQSGSDAVLRAMKRRYSVTMALRNIEYIKEAFPSACFTTDLMVGFPAESEDDFNKTCELVSRAEFIDAHVFAYSRRKNTPAYDFPSQIPEDVKHLRSSLLIAHKNKVRDTVLSQIVASGEKLNVIIESIDKDGNVNAHSDSYLEVRVNSEGCSEWARALIGKWIYVTPVSHKDGIVYSERI